MLRSRRLRRGHAALGLLIGVTASSVLLGCQRFVPPATAPATITPEIVDASAFQPVVQPPVSAVQPDLPFMPGAVVTGEFERMDPPLPAPATSTAESESAPVEEEAAPAEDTGALFESGIASTYGVGDGFQGNRTACGQRFNTHVPQAAHKTLPCGTMVRVQDSNTGKSVVVEVTDRGPYVRGRVVDLSWAAFSELYPKPDLLRVNVYVLGQ